MEFKVIEGNTGFIENKLNKLKKEYDINILGIASSARDPQLGVGGIAIIFTLSEIKEINIGDISISETKPFDFTGFNDYLDTAKGEKSILDILKKQMKLDKPKKRITRNTKTKDKK